MQEIFEYMVSRFSHPLQVMLKELVEDQEDQNPNEKLRKGAIVGLEEMLKNPDDYGETDKFELACLCCYVTQKMKADEVFIQLLKQIKHPYIEIFVVYFEENPSNYLESFEKIKKLSIVIKEYEDYNEEMDANIAEIHSWIYGQQGDIAEIKEIYKKVRKRIPETDNLIEQFGLLEALMNSLWWFLHSGVDVDFDEIISFVNPYIKKFKFYKVYTSFLNVKGSKHSFMGDNAKAMASFEELVKVHEEFNDDYRLSIAIGNLAEVYLTVGKTQKAKDMMERAINLYKESTGQWPYLYLTEIGNMYYLSWR